MVTEAMDGVLAELDSPRLRNVLSIGDTEVRGLWGVLEPRIS